MVTVQRRIDTRQTIELAEGVEIHLRVAGPYLRAIAYGIDLIIELALILFGAIGMSFLSVGLGDRVGNAVSLLGVFLIWWFYHVVFELSRWGATPGKMLMKLRVVDESGSSLTLGQSMVRNIIRGMELVIPFLPLVPFFHPRFQRVGDLAAGSLVIHAKGPEMPIAPPPLDAEQIPMRMAVTREEEAALIAFQYRGETYSVARKEELAGHLSKLTGTTGAPGVQILRGMANWLENRR